MSYNYVFHVMLPQGRKMVSIEKGAKFMEWLNGELQERGWSDRELLRRAGLASSVISKARTEGRYPSWEACAAIARALDLPPELVLRKIGLLPTDPSWSADTDELLHLFDQLDEGGQEEMLAIARTLYETRKRKRNQK